MSALTADEQRELLALHDERQRRIERTRLQRFRPYLKQREFYRYGCQFRERLLCAGNQLGKTLGAGYEVAVHATGLYPPDWSGRRFTHPVVIWVGGVTTESTRDNPQRILLGRPDAWGSGLLPYEQVGPPGKFHEGISRRQGIADAVDMITVRHVGGGYSYIMFKAYEQGREKWQGDTVDVVWLDEEPPLEIYEEALTRTNAGDEGRGGMVLMTFTPLLGMSRVVKRFFVEKPPGTVVVSMTLEDAEHYTPEQRAAIRAAYPEHTRKARADGIPSLGSGAVFPVDEDSIVVDPFPIPSEWPRIIGLDFGWDHPTAAAWLAWDRDRDVIYVTQDYAEREKTPLMHTANIRRLSQGEEFPVAWPHDGLQHDKGSGEQLSKQYKELGLPMLPEKATFEDGGNGVEAGVMEMLDMMMTGQWKVFRTCQLWLQEFRLYHRENGLIVKQDDDVISASRYAYMMRRMARCSVRKAKPRLNFTSEFR